ncbi:hypothetical protein TNCV_4856061 [Trichonephila clavipes]|nr:hypothetical protein TNCV_4856061 [Trichonephila clavipes]
MVLMANDKRTSCPCHDEFRGPRSDYVRQPEVTGFISTNGNRPVNPSLETQSQVTGGRIRAVNWSSNLGLTASYLTSGFITGSGIFDVKGAPRTGKPVTENVEKITGIIDVDRQISSRNISQELKIDHKTVLDYLCEVGFMNKIDVWMQHQLIPKIMM